MKIKPLESTLVAGLLLYSCTGLATPLQRADVASDPVWVAHLDCDALRPTAIGQFILAEMDKPDAQGKIAAFQAVTSIDLRTQVHGLTLYGTSEAPEAGVLLLYADFERERLATLAKGAKDYQSTTYHDHTIHSWMDEHRHSHSSGAGPRTYAAVHGSRVIIFGQRESSVSAALDVLDHSTPNLTASRAFGQLGAGGSGTFIQAAARKMDLLGSEPGAAIFRLSKLAQLQVGEAQQRITATLSLEANDDEVAKSITSIGDGLVSLLKLQSGKPQAARIASALALKQDGASVVATLALPTSEAIEIIKSDSARKEQKRAEKKDREQ